MDIILVRDPLVFEDDERIPSVFVSRENRVGPVQFAIIALKHRWKEHIIAEELSECCGFSKHEALDIINRVKEQL